MPKVKTNKAVKKRFKLTKNRKLLASKSKRRHILTDRTPKSKRQNRGWHEIDKTDYKRIIKLLPHGRK